MMMHRIGPSQDGLGRTFGGLVSERDDFGIVIQTGTDTSDSGTVVLPVLRLSNRVWTFVAPDDLRYLAQCMLEAAEQAEGKRDERKAGSNA